MLYIKKLCMRFLLLAEIGVFGYIYFFGTNGIQALHKQQMIAAGLQKNIEQIKNEIQQLKQEIYLWQTDDFYKEKIAREQLQMARKDDQIFYIG